ncbi:hypothetical protein RB2116 [Rhodopirellula baltica SH 1]|uniref:Uncharacterized protein n=1 Tax=Rhodopirellula baltica (strain DSM 10527 / NCIMB 13988 / SH1) TaxID=243090 RepID=Q7UWD0_RHOBA|nr:hypothetical protein RB2116 [Rhodopirellula baltica SH 1]
MCELLCCRSSLRSVRPTLKVWRCSRICEEFGVVRRWAASHSWFGDGRRLRKQLWATVCCRAAVVHFVRYGLRLVVLPKLTSFGEGYIALSCWARAMASSAAAM